jgi:hypothetical protein
MGMYFSSHTRSTACDSVLFQPLQLRALPLPQYENVFRQHGMRGVDLATISDDRLISELHITEMSQSVFRALFTFVQSIIGQDY